MSQVNHTHLLKSFIPLFQAGEQKKVVVRLVCPIQFTKINLHDLAPNLPEQLGTYYPHSICDDYILFSVSTVNPRMLYPLTMALECKKKADGSGLNYTISVLDVETKPIFSTTLESTKFWDLTATSIELITKGKETPLEEIDPQGFNLRSNGGLTEIQDSLGKSYRFNVQLTSNMRLENYTAWDRTAELSLKRYYTTLVAKHYAEKGEENSIGAICDSFYDLMTRGVNMISRFIEKEKDKGTLDSIRSIALAQVDWACQMFIFFWQTYLGPAGEIFWSIKEEEKLVEVIGTGDREKLTKLFIQGEELCKKLLAKPELTPELEKFIIDYETLVDDQIVFERDVVPYFRHPMIVSNFKQNLSEVQKSMSKEDELKAKSHQNVETQAVAHPWRQEWTHYQIWSRLHELMLEGKVSDAFIYNLRTGTIDWQGHSYLADQNYSYITSIKNEKFGICRQGIYWFKGRSEDPQILSQLLRNQTACDKVSSLNNFSYTSAYHLGVSITQFYEIGVTEENGIKKAILNHITVEESEGKEITGICLFTPSHIICMNHKLTNEGEEFYKSELVLIDRSTGKRVASMHESYGISSEDEDIISSENRPDNIGFCKVRDRVTYTGLITMKSTKAKLAVCTYRLGRVSNQWIKLQHLLIDIPDQYNNPTVLFRNYKRYQLLLFALTFNPLENSEVRAVCVTSNKITDLGAVAQFGGKREILRIVRDGKGKSFLAITYTYKTQATEIVKIVLKSN